MGISMSSDFLLGLIIGMILVLILQQLTRFAGGVGQFIPLIVIFIIGACGWFGYWWWVG